MNERLNRFISLLKQIFELDKSDLDFGIYRVMNLRKAQIEEFLTERLPQMVQETLAPFAQGSKEEIRAKMKQIEDSVSEMGMTVDALPDTAQKKQQYLQLQKQLAEGADLAALETDVYSALYSFFNRYYEDGDFISKRRYKEGVYAIPYEGEEVKLYWANQDQYYIKTSENFKDYTFVFDGSLSISAWWTLPRSRTTTKRARTASALSCSLRRMKKTTRASSDLNMIRMLRKS